MRDIPHFQEILKITMSLMIANRTIDSNVQKKKRSQKDKALQGFHHAFMHIKVLIFMFVFEIINVHSTVHNHLHVISS